MQNIKTPSPYGFDRSKATFVAVLALLATMASPASAQYNYRIGDTRVQQGHNGLAGTGGTYINSGTLSRSAQAAVLPMPQQIGPQGQQPRDGVCGMSNGTSNNGGLQMARMGSTVGVAGDYMRSDLNPNFNLQRQQQQQSQRMQNQSQNQFRYRQPVLNRQPQVNYTTYGSATGQHYQNGGAAGYSSGSGSGSTSSYRGY